MHEHRFRHHPVLGTVVEVRVVAAADAAAAVDRAVVEEMGRLESIFSVYSSGSELSRWKRGEVDEPSPELATVLDAARDWQLRSGGRFNPLAGALTARWRAAEVAGREPDPAELVTLAASIRAPRYRLVDGRPVPTGDCADLDLNAFAKGWIVDAALASVASWSDAVSITVNAGGDLAHRGCRPIDVGIEHPSRPYDNEPPLAVIGLRNAGLATSGSARRGFRIGDRHWSHVIDPRTGRPVEVQASISVVAPDAATADAAATVLGVVEPDTAAVDADALGVACLVVTPDGAIRTSPGWPGPHASDAGRPC